MIKKELERDEAFAWEVLDTAPYAVLAMADGKGEPYCVPMSPARDGRTVYLHCARPGMVIGKGGAMLKKIASAARADCEEFLGCRVNLQCWVKVKSDWRDNEFLLNNFGFKQNPSNR